MTVRKSQAGANPTGWAWGLGTDHNWAPCAWVGFSTACLLSLKETESHAANFSLISSALSSDL